MILIMELILLVQQFRIFQIFQNTDHIVIYIASELNLMKSINVIITDTTFGLFLHVNITK